MSHRPSRLALLSSLAALCCALALPAQDGGLRHLHVLDERDLLKIVAFEIYSGVAIEDRPLLGKGPFRF